MKKFLSILLISIMALVSANAAFADESVTMYAPDGRTLNLAPSLVETYKAVGWYTEPPVLMYAADGRTLYVIPSEIEAYKSVGWYTERPIPMYAADGRTLYVVPSEVEAYEAVGWSKTEPKKVPMYSSDGRTIYVLESQVDAYKNVGWYTEPFVEMYDVNGNTIYVQKSQVGAYKKVGWYETYEEAYNAKNAAINNAAASKFKIGMSVRNQTFLYTAYGTVKDINGGKIQVLWTSLYDSNGNIADWGTEMGISIISGISIGETTWVDAADLQPLQ